MHKLLVLNCYMLIQSCKNGLVNIPGIKTERPEALFFELVDDINI